MTARDRSLLSTFLCIALVITMLPLLGGTGPAAARGQDIKEIHPGDVIFVYENDLNLTPLDFTGGLDLLSLTKFVDDDISKARIKEIPVTNTANFDVLATQVGSDFGKYYATNVTGAIPGMFVQIAQPAVTLGVVLSGSHTTPLNGKSVSPDTTIAFRISSPLVGTSYKTSAGVYKGELAIEITTPGGAKVWRLGTVNMSPITVSRGEFYTDDSSIEPWFAPISLSGAEPGTYSARAKWITPDWQNRANLDSNTVTFTIQGGSVTPVATRGASIKDVRSGNTIFLYETGLDLTALDGSGGADPIFLVKFVDNDISKARIKEIPIANAASFSVLASQVGTDFGRYYAADATGVNPIQYVQIAKPEATLGVVLSGSHATSVDGKSLTPDTSIAFRIASPQVGTSYVTDASVAEGQLGIEITTPSGAKVQQLGGVSLSPINISGTEQFTGAMPLKGAEAGTYTAVATWGTPSEWKGQAPVSNTVTFTVQLDSTAMVTFSGQVTDSAGKALPGIWVYFWRQDGKKAFYAVTGADGKYSAQVEKSKLLSQRYNIAANKDNADPDHPKNSQYSTAELTNVAPTMNRAGLNFRLASGLVTLGGRVTDYYGRPLADIWVYFWRQDGKDTGYVKTNATGYYTRQVTRYPSTDRLHRYNIAANKDNGDPNHPKNPSFGTKELVNIVPDMNRLTLNFKLAPSR